MKRNATATLIKDIILTVIFYAIGSLILAEADFGNTANNVFAPMFIAGIPFGWRWASKLITAVSIKGIGIKLSIAFFLGWFAIYVVLIGDIISFIASIVAGKKQSKRILESA